MRFLLIISAIIIFQSAFGQNTDEHLIRQLEDEQRQAILKGDSLSLSKYMSLNIVVQNPDNRIINYQQVFSRIQAGKIDYGEFQRNIENISIVNNIAIVMGNEVIVARGNTANAGKKVVRRYTNVWMKEADTWKITARQATIISFQ